MFKGQEKKKNEYAPTCDSWTISSDGMSQVSPLANEEHSTSVRTATEVARSDFWLSCSFCSEESRQIFLPKEGFEECKLQEERAGVRKQVPNHLKQQKGRTSVAGKTSHAEQGLSS